MVFSEEETSRNPDCGDDSSHYVDSHGGFGDDSDLAPSSEELALVVRDCIDIVERIRHEDPEAMERLYAMFGKGVRFYICRQLGPQELEDKVHDTFLIVVQAIRRGELREPERLMGFVRTVVRRQIAAWIDGAVHDRKDQADMESSSAVPDQDQDPEERVMRREQMELMLQVLHSLPQRERDILTRFYLDEQTAEEICDDLGLSETQFRLLKSRAKARFGQIGRKRLLHRALSAIFSRL